MYGIDLRVGDKLKKVRGNSITWNGRIKGLRKKLPDYVEVVEEHPNVFVLKAHFSNRFGEHSTITECVNKSDLITGDVTFERMEK